MPDALNNKLVHLVHKYMEKLWKTNAVECKNTFCVYDLLVYKFFDHAYVFLCLGNFKIYFCVIC